MFLISQSFSLLSFIFTSFLTAIVSENSLHQCYFLFGWLLQALWISPLIFHSSHFICNLALIIYNHRFILHCGAIIIVIIIKYVATSNGFLGNVDVGRTGIAAYTHQTPWQALYSSQRCTTSHPLSICWSTKWPAICPPPASPACLSSGEVGPIV